MKLDLNKSSGSLNLSKAGSTLKEVVGILNWDVSKVHGVSLNQGFDLDIFAFILDKNEKLVSTDKVVYFGNKSYNGGLVSVPVDNRTGEGDDDEEIHLKLSQLPSEDCHIDVYVSLYGANERKQNFGMIANANFVLKDAGSNTELVNYNVSTYTNETMLHIGRFSNTNDGWVFTPSGDAAIATANDVISAY